MNQGRRIAWTLGSLTVCLLALAWAFLLNLRGGPVVLQPIPPLDPQFTNTATVRRSYADLLRAKEDVSEFDCYACHERDKPAPALRYDTNQKLILPDAHNDIVMGHGHHNRNNNCYNCHNEANLELLQTRDGRELKLAESTPLCGSCHGPTYRDWEAGAHGRINGYWEHQLGPMDRKDCVNCHNPHAPAFPPQKPAPGPHPLHPIAKHDQTHSGGR